MSLAADLRAAWESGEPDAPNPRVTMINYDIDHRILPANFDLTPEEADQMARLREHIRIVAKHDAWDISKEGSLAGMAAKCSPNVRAAILASREFVERFEATSGRMMPFDERREMPKPDELDQRIIDRDAHEQIVGGLHNRLGTAEAQQNQINNAEPTMRDYVSASVDAHEGAA